MRPARAALCRWATLVLALAVGFAGAGGGALAGAGRQPDSVIGAPARLVARVDDTLLDIARTYDLGYVEIRAANPGVDPWLPGGGREIVLPTQHVLPNAPHRGIVINLAELRLYYYPPDGSAPRSYPIGIGGAGKETPVGRTRIVRKQQHPVWTPTASERAEEPGLPDRIGPGPDDPMGDYALYLGWSGYAIHGTNRPYSIGRRDSHGCIRLYPEDIADLYRRVGIGTPVTVVDQPVKIGWLGGALYLEVHAGQDAADAIEADGRFAGPSLTDADDAVAKAAGAAAAAVDWYVVDLAALRRSGVAVRVSPVLPSG